MWGGFPDSVPRVFKIVKAADYPAGRPGGEYGCYFPGTDLVITDMGGRGTGSPEGTNWFGGWVESPPAAEQSPAS